MYLLWDADGDGRLRYCFTLAFRQVELVVMPVRTEPPLARPSQLTVVHGEIHRGASRDPEAVPPKEAYWMIPAVVAQSEGDSGIQVLRGVPTRALIQTVTECFPSSATIPPPTGDSDNESGDSDASEPEAAGAGRRRERTANTSPLQEPSEKRPRMDQPATNAARAEGGGAGGGGAGGGVQEDATEAVTVVRLSQATDPEGSFEDPRNRSRVLRFDELVARDLAQQYTPRGDAAKSPHIAFVLIPITLHDGSRRTPDAPASAPAEAGDPEQSRLLHALAGFGHGLPPALADVAVTLLHPSPAAHALFVPSRSAPPGVDVRDPTEARLPSLSASETEEMVPWHMTLYSGATHRRSDWFGGGKTPEEMSREMRQRFASGSFRRLVPPVRSWEGSARERAALESAVGTSVDSSAESGQRCLVERLRAARPEWTTVRVPDTLRQRKVVAGPNRDLFLLVGRAGSRSPSPGRSSSPGRSRSPGRGHARFADGDEHGR